MHPLIAQILTKRGLTDPAQIEAFLHAGLDRLEDPFRMKGMDEAVRRVRLAVENREKILLHGDYDIDGICGTAILAKALTMLGGTFETFLPDRAEDGYGVSPAAVEKAKSSGVTLFITIDCGITAADEIRSARDAGMDVLVIDHHRIAEGHLPPASVILNPLQSDCPYPHKDYCAAGLVFRFSQALLGERALESLDLAALATVGDVAPLVEENRILVKEGLKLLSERKNTGLRALAEAAKLKSREMNAGHLGFVLGPRINAAGRMSSPDIALRLLLTDNPKEAESLARVLDEENKARRKEEKDVLDQAVQEVERTVQFNRDRVIVVGREGWHAGVIGIVASRLVERYNRPALVIAVEKGRGKGSGRSIKGFHLFQALEACRESLEEYGGHELAAGFALSEPRIGEFRKAINEYARERTTPDLFVKRTRVDLEIGFADLNLPFVRELQALEPHGCGNPKPVFLTRDLLIKTRPQPLGTSAFKFFVTDGVATLEAVLNDRGQDRSWMTMGNRVGLCYSIKIQTWDGLDRLVLEIKSSYLEDSLAGAISL
ncbi:MAG: single-stranded-DNA-specific exonuclease RecJ [Candidatus Omnitrophota bacterium]|jgi:single-stranded-DNA-specific exonuclease